MDPIDRLSELLDADPSATANTSMRLPESIRDAARIAVDELGLAASSTELTVAALRSQLDAAIRRAALDGHYRRHPSARPTLFEQARAAARLDGHPLADDDELLRRAAEQIVEGHPDADADAVLLWAEALARAAA